MRENPLKRGVMIKADNLFESYEDMKSEFHEEDFFSGEALNFVCGYMHQSYRYTMHKHEFYELNIVTAGSGIHYLGQSAIPVKSGDVFVIPPSVIHSYLADENMDIYHILIKRDFFERYNQELCSMKGYELLFDIEPYVRLSSGKPYNLKLGYEALADIMLVFEKMEQAERGKSYAYLNSMTLSLIAELGEEISKSLENSQTRQHSSTELLKIMQYIQSNLQEKITLDTLSEVFNMSTATLNRRFRETLKLSPMGYVKKCRQQKAKKLISEGALSKNEIAQLCGFYDVSHMNKALV